MRSGSLPLRNEMSARTAITASWSDGGLPRTPRQRQPRCYRSGLRTIACIPGRCLALSPHQPGRWAGLSGPQCAVDRGGCMRCPTTQVTVAVDLIKNSAPVQLRFRQWDAWDGKTLITSVMLMLRQAPQYDTSVVVMAIIGWRPTGGAQHVLLDAIARGGIERTDELFWRGPACCCGSTRCRC